jgi:low affinity Fe/Cu permease
MDRLFTTISGRVAGAAGQPFAFIVAALVIATWALTGSFFGYSDTWQLVINTATTIVTFLMVFLIQNSQNRDAAAMQAKLDELIRALADARSQFIGIEHLPDSDIIRIRDELEEECREQQQEEGSKPPPTHSVNRLLRRY